MRWPVTVGASEDRLTWVAYRRRTGSFCGVGGSSLTRLDGVRADIAAGGTDLHGLICRSISCSIIQGQTDTNNLFGTTQDLDCDQGRGREA